MMAEDISGSLDPGQPKAGQTFLFMGCFVALVATSFAFIIRVMVMDDWQVAFGLSETQKGEIYGAGMWPFGLSIVLFSLVIDRVGYGKSMIFAFACHVLSTVLLVTAQGYWWLYVGSFLNGLAAGTVEAVINPVVATMYPKQKTKMLTILHAGWPGGFALAGIILLLVMGPGVSWKYKVAIIMIPTILYGLMLLRRKFPVHERVAAGVPYKDMLKEAGALGWLIVVYMVCMEVNRVLTETLPALPKPWLAGNVLDLPFFDLPSVGMTIVMAVLVVAYFAYTRAAGRPMYVFLLLVMILLAITELGTDTWIKDLMKPAMTKLGLDAGWVLVYTATIMTILRFCIGPIEKLLKPLGVLFISALLAATGIYMLSRAEGASFVLAMATIYGTGQCFFWPVTLGVVAERFPKGGALTINAMGGVGMLGVGILGSQLLGFWQDTRIDRRLQDRPALYAEFMDRQEKKSIFGEYKSLNGKAVNRVEDAKALLEYRQKLSDKLAATAGTMPATRKLEADLVDDAKYKTLVRNAVDHLAPENRDEIMASFASQLGFLRERKILLDESNKQAVEEIKKKAEDLDEVRNDARRNAMASAAVLPMIMAVCYLGLIIYFRRKGGYRPIELTAEGEG